MRSLLPGALVVALHAQAGLQDSAPPIVFDELAASSGLGAFRHSGGSTAEKRYIPEVMSGGVCALDFDGDGWTDIFLVNGGSFESLSGKAPPPPHGLFRNRRDGSFEDVTPRSGIRNAGWGMGCAAADYDGDGRPDLYVTYFNTPNQLWRNRGDGAFEDVTLRTGTGGPPGRWSTGATFGDSDGDGDLDLFVAGYVELDIAKLPEPGESKHCRHHGLPVNCGPRGLPGQGDLLFQNNGDGTFREVAATAGVADPEKHYGLGTVFLPLEGSLSLFVANDSTPNAFYRHRGGGRFEERGLESGLALSEEGHEQACMGVAWGDYDGDGRIDLHVTNFVDDYNTLYRNLGGGLFEDVSRRAQLAQPTWLMMGWGTAFADFDLDGRPDLVVANGHVYPQVDALKIVSRYRMPVQVFRNAGDGTFLELPRRAAPGEAVGRGLAVADFWNEGRLSFVVNNLDGPPALYRNRTRGGRFVQLRLQGTGSNRDAIGSLVEARWPGGRAVAVVANGGSYLSSHDPRVHIGVGAAEKVELEVRWPTGRLQYFPGAASDRAYRLAEGGALEPLTAARGSERRVHPDASDMGGRRMPRGGAFVVSTPPDCQRTGSPEPSDVGGSGDAKSSARGARVERSEKKRRPRVYAATRKRRIDTRRASTPSVRRRASVASSLAANARGGVHSCRYPPEFSKD